MEKLGCLPVRNIMNNKEFSEIFARMDTLIIDVTEQRITRPSNEDIQADYYSGKKGVEQHPIAHTVKRLLITDEEKPIHFLSKCFIGGGATPRRKSHDYAILKSLFKPVESSWFNHHHIKEN